MINIIFQLEIFPWITFDSSDLYLIIALSLSPFLQESIINNSTLDLSKYNDVETDGEKLDWMSIAFLSFVTKDKTKIMTKVIIIFVFNKFYEKIEFLFFNRQWYHDRPISFVTICFVLIAGSKEIAIATTTTNTHTLSM